MLHPRPHHTSHALGIASLLLLTLALTVTACASGGSNGAGGGGAGAGAGAGAESGPQQAYADEVQRAFVSAEEAFESGDFLEAVRRFNRVRTKYPYSRYAALAELRIADAYFAQEKYASAIEQYRTFAKLHPNHPQETYARFRVALSFFEQMPDDVWIFPPAYERDLARARDAERELRFFLNRYGDDEYGPRARRLLRLVRRRLADHELYVARFYLDRQNPRAAARRLVGLLQDYPGLGLGPQALFLLARSYLELGDTDRARAALDDLIRNHPESSLAEDARDYLERHDI